MAVSYASMIFDLCSGLTAKFFHFDVWLGSFGGRTYRSLINVIQLGLALLWAYVVFFKTVSFGLLAWSQDQPAKVSLLGMLCCCPSGPQHT